MVNRQSRTKKKTAEVERPTTDRGSGPKEEAIGVEIPETETRRAPPCRRAEKRHRATAPLPGSAVSQALHGLLSVTDNLIVRLMDMYRSVFVLDAEKKSDFYKDQGFAYFDRGKNEEAISSFLTYLQEFNPKDADVLYYTGLAYARMQMHARAIAYFQKAEKLVGRDPDIVRELATCYVETGDDDRAIEYLRQAVEFHPQESRLYYMCGGVHERKGEMEKAIEMYEKAIDLNPRETLYYHALGFVHETAGRHKEAIDCFKKAMELEKHR